MKRELMKKELMEFIVNKVKENTSPDRPYFFVRWSGLAELCQLYGYDLLALIDEMCDQGLIKKALIKKRLAIYLPHIAPNTNKKLQRLRSEFEEFLKQKQKS